MNPVSMQHIPLGDGATGLRPASGDIGGAGSASDGAGVVEGFGDALSEALDATNDVQVEADNTVEAFVGGEEMPVHQVMLALSKADASMRLATAVTSKAISAYQEIARLQV